MDTKNMIKALSVANGVSGAEKEASDVAISFLKDFATIKTSPLGDVIATVIEPKENKKHFLLDAHIDSIGMIVRYIDDKGFIHVGSVGGIDRRTLPTAQVNVWGEKKLTGFVCSTPPHLQKDDSVPELDKTYIDIGYTKEEAEKLVKAGDRITLDLSPVDLIGSLMTGSFMDDRCGCAAIIKAAKMISERGADCGLSVVLSTREETGGQGAAVSSYAVKPTHAIAVDVSFGTSPDCNPDKCSDLGSGAMICISPCLSKEMSNGLIKTAKEHNIPYTLEVCGGKTSTNADDITVSGCGVETAIVSIPLKYMHMPVETLDVNDVDAVANLICEYVCEEASK